jgi:Ribbon-helix-helix domain
MSRKKISTTIYVTPEQNEQLKLLHARTNVPVAVFIREGIDLVLARHAHLLPGQLQLTASSSVRHEPARPEAALRDSVLPTTAANQEAPAAAGDRRT